MNDIVVNQLEYKQYIENRFWLEFTNWLKDVSFDPRNGENMDTIFWHWYISNKKADEDFMVDVIDD